jgi:dolichol-phosphate mannosyltransferase
LPKLLVIIPTYNEIENIDDIIRAVFSLAEPFEILIIDDNSPDKTSDAVKNLMKNEFNGKLHILEREGKLGLGTAYILGFKWAIENKYDFVFEMDADFSHNPEDLPRLYEACYKNGADLAIGSRYITGANVVNWPLARVLMSYYASKYVRIVTGMKVKDTTAGFVCYNIDVLKTLELDNIKFKGYAFQIEMKFLTWKFKYKIKEVPIIFTDRKKGVSKMSNKIFKEAFLGVIQMKMHSIFRKYRRKVA